MVAHYNRLGMFAGPVGATLAEPFLWSLGGLLAAGLACVAYGTLFEPRWFRARRYRLEVLPQGEDGLDILHLSDLHIVRGDRPKVRFLSSLPRPDVAVITGDILGEPEAVETAVDALRGVRGRLGSFFVLGSNDYFVPRPLNYAWYFRKKRRRRVGERSRAADLVRLLEGEGWIHLENRKAQLSADGFRLEVLGLDDPHIGRHDLRAAPREDPGAVGLAVVHSPDPAPELAALGYDIVLAGHTHGGQVRLPVIGAVVTNSTLPAKLASGLARVGPAILHVSPGLGTSKYAPFRFLCRPEATLLELAPAEEGPAARGAGRARQAGDARRQP